MKIETATTLKPGTELHFGDYCVIAADSADKKEIKAEKWETTGPVKFHKSGGFAIPLKHLSNIRVFGYLTDTNLRRFHLAVECSPIKIRPSGSKARGIYSFTLESFYGGRLHTQPETCVVSPLWFSPNGHWMVLRSACKSELLRTGSIEAIQEKFKDHLNVSELADASMEKIVPRSPSKTIKLISLVPGSSSPPRLKFCSDSKRLSVHFNHYYIPKGVTELYGTASLRPWVTKCVDFVISPLRS